MRRKNLMRLTAAMGMMMACSQVMQAAAPVWGNETVEETTAGSHDDLIEIPTLEDEEYPVDQGKQNYVDTIVQADNRIGSMLMEKLTAKNENVFISSYSIATALTLLSHCSESGGQIEQLKEFLDLNNMSESEILAAQEELAALLGTNKENQEDESEASSDSSEEVVSVESDDYSVPKSILETANAMYVDEKMKMSSSFDDLADILSNTYQASLKRCDLSSEETMNEINDWVNEKTHGLIPSILDEPMDPSIRMTLLNAVYFKAAWVNAFEKEELKYYFPEFELYEGQCRFNGCDHIHEPGCAVKEAVEKGKIHAVRYEDYKELYEELKNKRRY